MPDLTTGAVAIPRPAATDSFSTSIVTLRDQAQAVADSLAVRSVTTHTHSDLATNAGNETFRNELLLSLISTPGVNL